jgi:hypothetical protein
MGWRLYVAGSARMFDLGSLRVHQMLAVGPAERGASGFGLRPDWDCTPLRGEP